MDKGTVLVVGAAGDVGRGIVRASLDAGRQVVAAARKAGPLSTLALGLPSDRLVTVQGDLADEAQALRLWEQAIAAFGEISYVVLSINAPHEPRTLGETSADDVSGVFDGNVLPHFIAATTFLPRMPAQGMLIGLGGGTADFVFPGMVPVSMAQAALRMLYRGLAKERRSGPSVRELLIVSMVAGESNRASAQDDWVTDLEVGRHVNAILDAPERFPKPILYLRSRGQVGQPEAEA